MTSDKVQALTSMSTRQKVIAAVFVVVIIIILWQLKDMFGGSSESSTPVAKRATSSSTRPTAAGGAASPQNLTPKVVDIMQTQPTTEREAELMKLQQETEMKYLQALNELQVLKVRKEIANTNKDISTAQLSKVVAEKKIVDLLAPPPPPPQQPAAQSIKTVQTASFASSGLDLEAKYTVISVSQLQGRWNAVLNYKGNMFNVRVSDILPPDGSVVMSIGKDGVIIERDGNKRKISIVSAI